MNIDTLILSGGSTKGVSFLGSINYGLTSTISKPTKFLVYTVFLTK